MELTSIIIAVLGSGLLGAVVNGIINQNKNKADVMKQVTSAASELLGDYRAQGDELQAENAKLKVEQEAQAAAIANLDTKFVKMQLALVINISQIRALGHDPVIDLDTLEGSSAEDLRSIATSMDNITRRRREG